jgi:endonuclease-3
MDRPDDEKAQTALESHEALKRLYDDRVNLLDHSDAWQLLVAVALSAQTTDEQVNKVTARLFSRWPGPADLADAPLEDIEEMVRSTGYYRNKAKNIRAAARVVMDDFGGEVPSAMDELIRIPGIGRKSAGVILHHVFGKPAIIVDTHFGRVVSRLGLLSCDPAEKKPDPLRTEREIAAILPADRWSSFSMIANLHGRRICTARKPLCAECALEGLCAYARMYSGAGRRSGVPDSPPGPAAGRGPQ